MDKQTLKAEKRELTGRKVKRLRKEGIVPANIFGKNVDSMPIQVKLEDFSKVFEKAGETSLVDLDLGGEKRKVLVTNIQTHPVSSITLHVDFHQVNLKEKVTAEVPVEVIGESPAEKSGLGTLVVLIDSITVEALPTEIPEKFEIDVTSLVEADQSISVSDLKFDKSKVEIQNEAEDVIAKIEPPQAEEEPSTQAESGVGEEGDQAVTSQETPTEASEAGSKEE